MFPSVGIKHVKCFCPGYRVQPVLGWADQQLYGLAWWLQCPGKRGTLEGQEHDAKVQVLHPAYSKRDMGGDAGTGEREMALIHTSEAPSAAPRSRQAALQSSSCATACELCVSPEARMKEQSWQALLVYFYFPRAQ